MSQEGQVYELLIKALDPDEEGSIAWSLWRIEGHLEDLVERR